MPGCRDCQLSQIDASTDPPYPITNSDSRKSMNVDEQVLFEYDVGITTYNYCKDTLTAELRDQVELEERREFANNRLQEYDELNQQHRDALKEIRQLRESVIVETTECKCLQSQLSVLYNESMQLKTQLDDTRQQLQSSKNSHLRYMEMMEQLQKCQIQDDAVLNVVNGYWNHLNADIRVLLERFDAKTADESEDENECEATTSFLMQLSSYNKEELDDKLTHRVQVPKVVQAFDQLFARNVKITLALKSEHNGDEAANIDEDVKKANAEIQAENRNLQMSELQDTIIGKDTLTAELRNQVDGL
ncbi:hypothetical protein PV326_007677 [Microctonus aethiopoides]|nr:hypothetical protein PV326_007677 [Microctonus aethiopoides]